MNDAFAALVASRSRSCWETELRDAGPARGVLLPALRSRWTAGARWKMAPRSRTWNAPSTRRKPWRPGTHYKQRLRHIDFSVTLITGPQGRRALLVGRDVTAAREVDQMSRASSQWFRRIARPAGRQRLSRPAARWYSRDDDRRQEASSSAHALAVSSSPRSSTICC